MITILLCDDEKDELDRIRNYIDTLRPKIRYGIDMISYTSAADALQHLRESNGYADILITDIDMPALSGMELVQTIRDEGLDIILIFMTAHAEYVFKSFEYSPFRYIRKEFMEIELLPALQTACERVNANRGVMLSVKTPDGMAAVLSQDILYYELQNRKCIIYTIQGKQYETWKKIHEMRNDMGEDDGFFLQIYRGCMVNKRHVKAIRSATIVLENDIEIPISRAKKQELSDIMMRYWSGII